MFRHLNKYDAKYESAVRWKARFNPDSGRGFDPDGGRGTRVFLLTWDQTPGILKENSWVLNKTENIQVNSIAGIPGFGQRVGFRSMERRQ